MSYQPQFTITANLLARVENIAALREKILAATVQVPWIPALQKETRLRNAHSSTAIKGNPLTLEQVRAVEEGRELAGVTDRAKREVLNYFAGLRFVEKNLKKSRLTHEDMLKLHKVSAVDVIDQGTAGRYRTIGVRMGRFVPPPPEVDEFYWEDRPRYYAELKAVRKQGGDLTGWLEYAAEGLLVTLEKVWTRVQRLSAESGGKKLVLRPKQEHLLQMPRDRKSMTPQEIWHGVGMSKQRALDLLRPLIKAGLVKSVGTRKSGRYILGWTNRVQAEG